MTIRRKQILWIPPVLKNKKITTTGGSLKKYFVPHDLYDSKTCVCEIDNGYLYPFDPETPVSKPQSSPLRKHVPKKPVFSTEEYRKIGCFPITQHVYRFESEDYAKKAFKYAIDKYEQFLKEYISMISEYLSNKNNRFDQRMSRKEDRTIRVNSNPEKVSKREAKLNKLQKKASN